MTVTDDQKTHLGPVDYVNYNIRFHSGWGSPTAKEVLSWIEENRIDGQLFESFDGGGSNGLILECQRSDELVQFCRDWLDGTGIRCWAEDQHGKHYAFAVRNSNLEFKDARRRK